MNNDTRYDQKVMKLRKLLRKEWDPIGLGENLNCDDEYDSYVIPILTLIQKQKYKQIRNYLIQVEKVNMGLDQADVDKIDKLIEIFKADL